jgi:hypothetical protein
MTVLDRCLPFLDSLNTREVELLNVDELMRLEYVPKEEVERHRFSSKEVHLVRYRLGCSRSPTEFVG